MTPPLTVMRWILPVGCLLFLMVILCGCLQSSSALAATPVPTAGAVVMLPDTTATPHSRVVVNVTAEKTLDSVVIRIDGGNDAGALTSLAVRINNYDGTSVMRTIQSPEIGRTYSIQYFRNANAANVNIIGTFSDGYQQTLLMTSL
jgi:hypothetical protein